MSADLLYPGTEIVKIGSTTGNTTGRLIGVENCKFVENSKEFNVYGAIVVRWEPGQRFTSGGDSGSVYYAKVGTFTFPIAIHRAQVVHVTHNYLDAGDPWLREVVSIGTPLRKVVEEFKSHIMVGELQWFKLKTLEERQKGCEEREKTCDY